MNLTTEPRRPIDDDGEEDHFEPIQPIPAPIPNQPINGWRGERWRQLIEDDKRFAAEEDARDDQEGDQE